MGILAIMAILGPQNQNLQYAEMVNQKSKKNVMMVIQPMVMDALVIVK